MNDNIMPVLTAILFTMLLIVIGSIGYLGQAQRSKHELVCREQMLQANRSTDDILKVCMGK